MATKIPQPDGGISSMDRSLLDPEDLRQVMASKEEFNKLHLNLPIPVPGSQIAVEGPIESIGIHVLPGKLEEIQLVRIGGVQSLLVALDTGETFTVPFKTGITRDKTASQLISLANVMMTTLG